MTHPESLKENPRYAYLCQAAADHYKNMENTLKTLETEFPCEAGFFYCIMGDGKVYPWFENVGSD